MHAVAEAALEPVPVQQREEELEVLFLAVVRRGGHEQEVAGEARQELAQTVALRVLDLAAEEGRRQLVRLVADDEVVAAVGRGELRLDVLVACELVQPRDGERVLEEPVAGAGGLELVVGEDLEGQLELARELVLPLLDEAPRAHDEAAPQVAARDQFLDEESRHDRLAGARIVGEEKAQRLPRQHGFVDGGDLVRQRLDQRSVDGQDRVEQVRQANAVRFGDEAKQRAVAVEAPRPPLLEHLEPRFVVPVEDLLRDPPVRRAVDEGERVRAVPLHAHDGHRAVGQKAPDGGVRAEVFELQVAMSLGEVSSSLLQSSANDALNSASR
jgi:hypothetical protein